MDQWGEFYLRIRQEKSDSYGGNQNWFPCRFLKRTGCGVIAAADVILYLEGEREISEAEYREFAQKLWKGYLPVIPGFGMNGLTLMIGMNRYFRKKNLPYRACWGISGKRMIAKIDRMLSEEIPVILSVGPNFPKVWGKEKVRFYIKTESGTYVPAVKTKAHFVTVTGRNGMWLQISSWGKKYFIDIREYREYVKTSSSPLISNMLLIKKKY